MYYLTLTLFLILYVTYKFWKNKNLPPGPWGLPIVGYLPWLNPTSPYLTLAKLSRKYGEIYGLHLGNVYTIILTNPRTIKSVFNKESTTGRAPLYLTHGIMQGYGLICAQGEMWKIQRKFMYNCLKQLGATKVSPKRRFMGNLIQDHALNFVKSMEPFLGKPVDPLEKLRHSLGSIINEIVFGISWNEQDPVWKWLQFLQEEGVKHIGVAGPLNFLPFLRFLPKFRNTMQFLIDGKNKTHDFYKKLIEEQETKLIEERGVEAKNVIQAFILERNKQDEVVAKKFFSDAQFYHLLADIFGASLDTTLTTLRWFLLYMAKHPKIQSTLRQELKQILQNQEPTLEDLPHLPYLEATICETQRIRPVVPIGIPHGTIDKITIDGYEIPPGTMIVPLQWELHMNNEVWTDPEIFNPERFLNDEGKVKKIEHFMPFQVGKRMCIGDELAKMFLGLFGAIIFSKFEICLEENVNFTGDCGITLTPVSHKLVFNKI